MYSRRDSERDPEGKLTCRLHSCLLRIIFLLAFQIIPFPDPNPVPELEKLNK